MPTAVTRHSLCDIWTPTLRSTIGLGRDRSDKPSVLGGLPRCCSKRDRRAERPVTGTPETDHLPRRGDDPQSSIARPGGRAGPLKLDADAESLAGSCQLRAPRRAGPDVRSALCERRKAVPSPRLLADRTSGTTGRLTASTRPLIRWWPNEFAAAKVIQVIPDLHPPLAADWRSLSQAYVGTTCAALGSHCGQRLALRQPDACRITKPICRPSSKGSTGFRILSANAASATALI
jgi:hypothetical protein